MAVEFYRYSLKTAKSENNEDLYRKSKAENIRCVGYIEKNFYNNAYIDGCVDSDRSFTKLLIKEFGMERLLSIYATTIKANIHDKRIYDNNKEWAKRFNPGLRYMENKADSTLTKLHIGIVNLLAKKAIEEYDSLNLYSNEHCYKELGDLEGKVVVISPKKLREEYWEPKYQLWLAQSGFGCRSDAIGRAVNAVCLADGDEARWNRNDVVGVLKDELMAYWARERYLKITNPDSEININELKM